MPRPGPICTTPTHRELTDGPQDSTAAAHPHPVPPHEARRRRRARSRVGDRAGCRRVRAAGAGTAEKPPPKVDEVDLTSEPAPVGTGWEGQVGTDANLVGVQWNGDSGAEFTVEVRDGDGDWRKASDIGSNDALPDAGSTDAVPRLRRRTARTSASRSASARTSAASGCGSTTARPQDVKLHVIDSFRGKQPEANLESTGTPAVPTTPAADDDGAGFPAERAPAVSGRRSGRRVTARRRTTTTTQPVQQGLGLGPGLAAAALATLAVAFIVRRRRALAVLIAAVVLVGTACAPTKGGGGGAAQPIPDAIVARSSWAPDLPWNWDACPGGPEYVPYMGTAIVHHTVNSNAYGPGDSAGMLRGIWAYHVQSLGYCDIAYNFLIDNYGTRSRAGWAASTSRSSARTRSDANYRHDRHRDVGHVQLGHAVERRARHAGEPHPVEAVHPRREPVRRSGGRHPRAPRHILHGVSG